ncbi:MAG: hypothetical protein ABIN01_10555 [Ferruginibacter sp.]
MDSNLYNENLLIHGGLAVKEKLPAVIPTEEFESLQQTLIISETAFNYILQKEENSPRYVKIFPVQSTSMACSVRKLDAVNALIVIPLGVIARIRVLARLLLKYWNASYNIGILNSPLDNIPENSWVIPEKLKPLLGSYLPGEEKKFWQDINELDKSIGLPEAYDNDVSELLHLALVHLASHEFAHFWQKHFELLKLGLTPKQLKKYDLTQLKIEKGVELHADNVAGQLSMDILLTQVMISYPSNDYDAYSRGFLRLSYITTLIFSLYDPRRKYLLAYDRNLYTHPLVRRHLIFQASDDRLKERGPELHNHWQANELHGWTKCMQALNDLNLDCLKGDFGPVDLSKNIFPIHINPGGSVSFNFIGDMVNDSNIIKVNFIKLLADKL